MTETEIKGLYFLLGALCMGALWWLSTIISLLGRSSFEKIFDVDASPATSNPPSYRASLAERRKAMWYQTHYHVTYRPVAEEPQEPVNRGLRVINGGKSND